MPLLPRDTSQDRFFPFRDRVAPVGAAGAHLPESEESAKELPFRAESSSPRSFLADRPAHDFREPPRVRSNVAMSASVTRLSSFMISSRCSTQKSWVGQVRSCEQLDNPSRQVGSQDSPSIACATSARVIWLPGRLRRNPPRYPRLPSKRPDRTPRLRILERKGRGTPVHRAISLAKVCRSSLSCRHANASIAQPLVLERDRMDDLLFSCCLLSDGDVKGFSDSLV